MISICYCCCCSPCNCQQSQPKSQAQATTSPAITYYQTDPNSKTDYRILLQTDTEDSVRSILTRYNPELCKYFCRGEDGRKAAVNAGGDGFGKGKYEIGEISRPQQPSKPTPKPPLQQPSKPSQPQTQQPSTTPPLPSQQPLQPSDLQYRLPTAPPPPIPFETREYPDTKFRREHSKQCMQNYGGVNTNVVNGGVVYGEYMKTHSINPHTGGNRPKTEETYRSALNFARRQPVEGDGKGSKGMLVVDSRNGDQKGRVERKGSKAREPSQNGYNKEGQQQYNGYCEHVYDRHDEQHRSRIIKGPIKQQDTNIDKQRSENYQKKMQEKQQRQEKPPTPKQVKPPVEIKILPPPAPAQAQPQQIQPPPMQPNRIVKIVELRNTQYQTDKFTQAPQNGKAKQVAFVNQLQNNSKQTSKNVSQINQKKFTNNQSAKTVARGASNTNKQQQNLQKRQVEQNYQQYCHCQQCEHSHCQCVRKMKQQIYTKAQQNPDLADRLISYAKRANMYKNYTFELDSLNRYPCHRNQFQKDYYDWPRYKLDPKNYKCQSQSCLRQIPYAGKGMLNGRYEYQPYHP